MKTVKIFGLLLMATLVFAACSKHDDEVTIDATAPQVETTNEDLNVDDADSSIKGEGETDGTGIKREPDAPKIRIEV